MQPILKVAAEANAANEQPESRKLPLAHADE